MKNNNLLIGILVVALVVILLSSKTQQSSTQQTPTTQQLPVQGESQSSYRQHGDLDMRYNDPLVKELTEKEDVSSFCDRISINSILSTITRAKLYDSKKRMFLGYPNAVPIIDKHLASVYDVIRQNNQIRATWKKYEKMLGNRTDEFIGGQIFKNLKKVGESVTKTPVKYLGDMKIYDIDKWPSHLYLCRA